MAETTETEQTTETEKVLDILGGQRLLKKVLGTPAKQSRGTSPGTTKVLTIEFHGPVTALAIEPGDVNWVDIIRSGLPSKSLERTADQLKLSLNDLSLRLRLTPRTVHRRVQKGQRLTPEESERNVRAARALAKARQILGEEDGRRWVLDSSRALGGAAPITLLDTADGFTAVMDELGRLEYGVIS